MIALLQQLIIKLTAIVAILSAQHAMPHTLPPHVFGGVPVEPPKWVQTTGRPLYDTPSGNLEIGDYAVNRPGEYIIMIGVTTYSDATTSLITFPPHTYTDTTEPKNMTLVHEIGTQYMDYFSDGSSYKGDPAIDSQFDKANAVTPTISSDTIFNANLTI